MDRMAGGHTRGTIVITVTQASSERLKPETASTNAPVGLPTLATEGTPSPAGA